jgi:hypothetical protein
MVMRFWSAMVSQFCVKPACNGLTLLSMLRKVSIYSQNLLNSIAMLLINIEQKTILMKCSDIPKAQNT